jgi:flagellar basal-body rod modification protein FlgD
MPTVDAAASSSNVRTLEDYQESQRTAKSKLGQDEFLKILTAQLANQDPLSPSSNGEFIAQMAQFSALEAMSAMSSGFMASQAYSMIGKYVYVQNGSDLVYGKVSGVVTEDGVNYLMIGDKYYDAKKVTGVVDPSAVESDLDDQILQSANLIGKTITAQIKSEDGQTTTTVTGEVEKLVVKDGAVYAVVGETNVPISSITEITNQEENLS